jgi:NADH-quinone oxidoreductase subunit J
MFTTILFFLFAGSAIGCACSLVYHRNPLYSAISLIGVFIALACIYVTLAAPFIAVTQILVYAGAIMVLVVFVIMLLNLDDDKWVNNLKYLYGVGVGLGLVLMAQTLFVYYAVKKNPQASVPQPDTGMTQNIGLAMYTEYLLPVEIVGILLLMAIVGAVIMSRRLNQPQIELVKANEDFEAFQERNEY